MKENSEILDKIGRRDGMTVPEGYFADFAARMTESLPPLEWSASAPAPRRTFWQKVRPYAYMAAMFAGIWCMMKMFGMMRSNEIDLSIENYPGLATALSDENFVKEYVYPDINDYDLLEDLYDAGIDPEEIFFADDDAIDPEADSDANALPND